MEALMIVGIVGGVVGLAVLIIVLSLYHEKKRRQAIAAVAASLNFTFQQKDDGNAKSAFKSLHLFKVGHSKRAYNVMRGSAMEMDVSILDYTFVTGSGKNRSSHSQTVVGFVTDKLSLPDFSLRPENFLHRIGGVFGYQDIDFPDYPVFSKAYLLRGTDEAAVRALFDDDALRFFEQAKGVSVEGVGDRFIFYRAGRRAKPANLRALMEEAFAAFSVFKRQA